MVSDELLHTSGDVAFKEQILQVVIHHAGKLECNPEWVVVLGKEVASAPSYSPDASAGLIQLGDCGYQNLILAGGRRFDPNIDADLASGFCLASRVLFPVKAD